MSAARRPGACPLAACGGLLLQSGRGDPDAFAQLYDVTCGPVYRLAVSLVGEANADEVLVQAYVEAWRTAPRFDPAQGTALAWLLRHVQRVAGEQFSGEVA
ncbi:sigma factor [Nocardioides jiangxiensis]|uniref:Sigma factor n=1 Tax=Nocardioides jiangxiensis TaxID=3064524 RepID=A0ABT9B0N4_9ACTN|nr:sigma factor [Nocardioides sp. WY-20]MDO7868415.1 sigma factor [Nocardioides sp. WY-20]